MRLLRSTYVIITFLFVTSIIGQEGNTELEKTTTTQTEEGQQTKKSEVKSKGMKLTEVDKDGAAINVGKRYAIVIGINDYNDTAISDLSKARNDAKAIGLILKDIGQFDQVFVMTDDVDPRDDAEHLYPTKLKIEEKIESVVRFMNKEDLIVFFFSGHGISDYDENGYLVTVDTVADKKFETALKVDWIVKQFKDKGIRKSLLVLDACRDVLYTSKSSTRDSIKEKTYTEAEIAATFYSTKAGYFSYEDDESDYGVFTKNLIYGMEGRADYNEDGVVSFAELQQSVEKGVKDWSIKKNKQQKPYTRLYGEKTGDLAITVASNPEKSLADKKVIVPSRLPYVWRSAIVPGWGQYTSRAKWRGISYFAIGVGLFGYHWMNMGSLNSSRGAYESAFAVPGVLFLPTYVNLQSKRNELESAESAATTSFALLFGFWIWNIVDAGFFTDLPKEDKLSGFNLQMRRDLLASDAYARGTVSVDTRNYVGWYWKF